MLCLCLFKTLWHVGASSPGILRLPQAQSHQRKRKLEASRLLLVANLLREKLRLGLWVWLLLNRNRMQTPLTLSEKQKKTPHLHRGDPVSFLCALRPIFDEPLTSKWLAVKVEAMSLTVTSDKVLPSIADPFPRTDFSSSMAIAENKYLLGDIYDCLVRLDYI